MKQHITAKQLDELSDQGKKQIKEWWKPKAGDWACIKSNEECLIISVDDQNLSLLWFYPNQPTMDSYASGSREIVENKYAVAIVDGTNDEYAEYSPYSDIKNINPLISLGQMIEFLDEHLKTDWSIFAGKELLFFGRSDRMGIYGKTTQNRNGELCDGLWEMIKEILER